jgi:hypothetical protein
MPNAENVFSKIADNWVTVSSLLDRAGKTGNIEFINEASEILKTLSSQEKKAMESLLAM